MVFKQGMVVGRTGVHVHVPWVHVVGAGQSPHDSVPPQPSTSGPHVTLAAAQVVCKQMQTVSDHTTETPSMVFKVGMVVGRTGVHVHVPWVHVLGAEQVPQLFVRSCHSRQ